jgi:hypothetical protein
VIPAITVGLRPFGSKPVLPAESPAALSPVSALLATISALPGGGVYLGFRLEGCIEALRVPEMETPDPWPLWQHTCFEAFLSGVGEERYREYNFSPAGLWAGSEFRRYREINCGLEGEGNPIISSARSGDALTLAVELPSVLLPGGSVWKVGLSAVIERADGQLDYWAVHHPAERPDFHHSGGWMLQLDTRLSAQ